MGLSWAAPCAFWCGRPAAKTERPGRAKRASFPAWWRSTSGRFGSNATQQPRQRLVSDEMASLAEIWEQFTPAELQEILSARSADEDLHAVACNTHKETQALTQQCARTAGLLCACLSSGVVTSLREVFGCERLSQRYFFVAALVAQYPEIKATVHDCGCHLHRFCAARSGWSAASARLAPPMVRYIGDIFHMTGHTDPWCMIHCNPAAPDLKGLFDGVRTSVCEFTFTWFSQYKHQSKHMSRGLQVLSAGDVCCPQRGHF